MAAKLRAMHERSTPPSLRSDDVPVAVRVQILATEHWSLLATRSMTFQEEPCGDLSDGRVGIGRRTGARGPGHRFRRRLLRLRAARPADRPGARSRDAVRLGDALTEDVRLVFGMNRLRHAYLEIAPELEPYFVTSHYDDEEGVLETLDRPPASGRAASCRARRLSSD